MKHVGHTLREVRNTLENGDTSTLLDCLMLLYKCQTQSEQRHSATWIANGKGFNAYDAKALTECSLANLSPYGLNDSQMREVRTRLPKYAKQIRNIWNGKQSLIS